MAEIKSALDLALERTASIKPDKEALHRKQATEKAQVLTASVLKNDFVVEEVQTALKAEAVRNVFVGIVEKNFVLCRNEAQAKTLMSLLEILSTLLKGDESFALLSQSLLELGTQYRGLETQVTEQVKKMYAPQFAQKKQIYEEQTGQVMPMAMEDDQEFVQSVRQQIEQYQPQFDASLAELKGELSKALTAAFA